MISMVPMDRVWLEAPYASADLRRLFGCYPTGVSVVTAHAAGGDPVALLIGSFTAVSLDPPLIGFLPMRSSRTWQQIAEADAFCINVLGSDQERVCHAMAAEPARRFENVAVERSAAGLPLLSEAILHIECTRHAVLEAGDHWFVLGRVDRIAAHGEREPLIFHRGNYGGFRPLGDG